MKSISSLRILCGVLGFVVTGHALAQFGNLDPTIKRDTAIRLGAHSHVIPDDNVQFVPNVGIVIGDKATLIIDTGMGTSNGRIVLDEALKLSGNTEFYLAATHYHPEHDLGAEAFPVDAHMLRWAGQQAEIDETGVQTIARFSQFSPVVADLLEGVAYRDPDIVFEHEIRLDLGGVHVRLIGVGPNHTRGDTVFFVEEDRVFYAGDVIMPAFPSASAQDGSIVKWIENMDVFAALAPDVIVPAHGRLLDFDSIPLYKGYLTAVRDAVSGLRSAGGGIEAGLDRSAALIADAFPELNPTGGAQTGRIVAALRAAARELQ